MAAIFVPAVNSGRPGKFLPVIEANTLKLAALPPDYVDRRICCDAARL
jgi:hypothetical protein